MKKRMNFRARLALLTAAIPDGCWIWEGANAWGYGHTTFEGLTWSCHTLAYTLLVGPIPEGLHIDHLCRDRRCFNPRHLEPVTQTENNRRAGPFQPNARKTHCDSGHPLTEGNVYRYGARKTHRACRVCRNLRNREHYRLRIGQYQKLPPRRSEYRARPHLWKWSA